MCVEDEDNEINDLVSIMASVSAVDCEANIDDKVSMSFYVPPSVELCLSPSSNVAFCNALNMRGDISKLRASIGASNVSSET